MQLLEEDAGLAVGYMPIKQGKSHTQMEEVGKVYVLFTAPTVNDALDVMEKHSDFVRPLPAGEDGFYDIRGEVDFYGRHFVKGEWWSVRIIAPVDWMAILVMQELRGVHFEGQMLHFKTKLHKWAYLAYAYTYMWTMIAWHYIKYFFSTIFKS